MMMKMMIIMILIKFMRSLEENRMRNFMQVKNKILQILSKNILKSSNNHNSHLILIREGKKEKILINDIKLQLKNS